MKTALITGINGMDGSHLADLLLVKGYKVYGMERRVSTPVRRNTEHLVGKIEFIIGDLTDPKSLINAIEVAQPDEVYNLAAQSFVGSSWGIPQQTCKVNAMGVLNLLEAIRQVKPDTKFYQASTSEMYGNTPEDELDPLFGVTERTKFRPRSPYGVAKLFAHHMAINYRESYDMFASCGILFNHESERRGLEFVTRKITDGVAQIVAGKQDFITLGNIDAKRDWGYAPDYVDAMWRILQHDEPTEFVIGTMEAHSVSDFIMSAFKAVDIRNWLDFIKFDERYMRPAEIHHLVGNHFEAHDKLGWFPTTPFDKMVQKMVLNDFRIHNAI